jgi:uncharacterized protein (DUF1778 family)
MALKYPPPLTENEWEHLIEVLNKPLSEQESIELKEIAENTKKINIHM